MIGNGQNCDASSTTETGCSPPIVSLRVADGAVVHRELRHLRASEVVAGAPWRTTRHVQGQAHFPGYYWSATTRSHVLYESRLELARLLLADFAREVVGIAAQPFRLRARVDGRLRHHVPDFLLVDADGSVRLVNVKPAGRFATLEVAEALAWPGRLIREHGWVYEVWTGDDPVYLANVRFLAGYRRKGLVGGDVLEAVLASAAPGDTVTMLTGRVGRHLPPAIVRTAVLRLLWEQRLITDLRHRRLDGGSVLRAAS